MLRVPKISSKPNEVSVSLSSTTSATLWSTPIQNDSILFKNGCCRKGENKTSRTSRRRLRQRSHCPVFSPFRSLPPPSQQNVKYLLDFFFCNIVWFSCRCYFKVVSLALTVCVWLVDSTCWLFLKTADTATGCHVEKRKKKVLFLWNGGKEKKKKQPPPSSLTSPLVKVCVYVCVHVCECVFLCANRQRAEAAERDGSRM